MKRALLGLGTVALCGCMANFEASGPDQHETQAVELDKAEMVRVELRMGAGEVQVDGGTPKLMDGDFTYNIASWKPIVKYSSTGFRGNLSIEQPRSAHGGSHVNYKWNVHLNETVPTDFQAELGAGEARLNLGSLNLRSVRVNMGVGEVRLDLRGKPARDYSVAINGGVGQATVYLPREVGVIANAAGGIGDISVRGLEKHNGHWINPAHENAAVTIHVDVHGGVGQISLIAE